MFAWPVPPSLVVHLPQNLTRAEASAHCHALEAPVLSAVHALGADVVRVRFTTNTTAGREVCGCIAVWPQGAWAEPRVDPLAHA